MSAAPTFTPQVLGQTEKALNAILDRLLTGTGVTEPQWVSLSLAVSSSGPIERGELTARVAGALKVSDALASERIGELTAAGLLATAHGNASTVLVTDAGRQLYTRVREGVAEVADRLWGDLPADDLATTGRVLSTILDRANRGVAGG